MHHELDVQELLDPQVGILPGVLLGAMGGTGSLSALALQIPGTRSLHLLQTAQVSWLGLYGPGISPWSAGAPLPVPIELYAVNEQMLSHPFSL